MDDVTFNSRLQSLQGLDAGQKKAEETQGAGPTFGEVLKDAINEVNDLQADADGILRDMQLGKDVDIHEAMIALNKMDLSFKLLMEVRSKILSAYEEVMRTQI